MGQTLNGELFGRLKESILTGELLPGQRLKVSQIAENNGVSLNVVREALNRLAGEQLVEVVPQIGFAVRGLSSDDLRDLVRQRIIFEGVALRQAIGRGDLDWQAELVAAHHKLSRTPITEPHAPDRMNPLWLARHEEFNLAMMKSCGSPRLYQIVRQLAEATAIYQRALLPCIETKAELNSEHSELLDAILRGDPDASVNILAHHLEEMRDLMLPFLETPPVVTVEVDDTAQTVAPRRGRPRKAPAESAPSRPLAAVTRTARKPARQA
ncbi:GntR family transcriptional regulator [Chitinasiproducens palmae]|uniref:GntR family transcriptional regulator n=1 Tax=Chitinasiproducens palmae TaxID=1770053 RepID=UPI001F1768A7|nr:GntR family transcriptional regulator [Chitinasiproducens palmae]